MSKIIFLIFIGVICFLYTLNLFLRGSQKQAVGSILGLLIFATIISSFFMFDWRLGLIVAISPFILIGIFRPIAKFLAYKMLGYRTGVDDPQMNMNNVLDQMAQGNQGFNKAMDSIRQHSEKQKERLNKLSNNPSISLILKKNNLFLDDYFSLFDYLQTSALHDLAWEIISTPDDLESLIKLKRDNATDEQIWSHFRDLS